LELRGLGTLARHGVFGTFTLGLGISTEEICEVALEVACDRVLVKVS